MASWPSNWAQLGHKIEIPGTHLGHSEGRVGAKSYLGHTWGTIGAKTVGAQLEHTWGILGTQSRKKLLEAHFWETKHIWDTIGAQLGHSWRKKQYNTVFSV